FEPAVEDTIAAGPMPLVIIDRLAINNVKAYYESQPAGILADVSLGDLLVELPQANLETNKVVLKTLNLNNSEVLLKMAQQVEIQDATDVTGDTVAAPGFAWPDWEVDVQQVSFDQNRIVYQSGEENPRSEEHTSELQSRENLVCRLLLEKKKVYIQMI